jgi:hypothetical protein
MQIHYQQRKINTVYNDLAPLFDLKPIRHSRFFDVQRKAREAGIVNVIKWFEHETRTMKRYIKVSLNSFASLLPAAFNNAVSRAKVQQARAAKKSELRAALSAVATASSDSNARCNCASEKNRSSNRETKDLKDHKDKRERKIINDEFYLSRFKEDAARAKRLQNKAKSGLISGGDAQELISLHIKHCVVLGESFERFLRFKVAQGRQAVQAKRQAQQQPRRSALDILEEKIANFKFNPDNLDDLIPVDIFG